MLYRYTEAQTMDFIHVSNIAVQRVYDMTSTFFGNSPIQREDITQLRFIITTAGISASETSPPERTRSFNPVSEIP